MNRNILLVVGITLLFLGVGIQPAMATVQIEKETGISHKIRTHIDRLKQLLDEYEEDDSKSSELNPEYKEELQEIYDTNSIFNEEINELKPNDIPIWQYIIYIILRIVFLPLEILFYIIAIPLFALFIIIGLMLIMWSGGFGPP